MKHEFYSTPEISYSTFLYLHSYSIKEIRIKFYGWKLLSHFNSIFVLSAYKHESAGFRIRKHRNQNITKIKKNKTFIGKIRKYDLSHSKSLYFFRKLNSLHFFPQKLRNCHICLNILNLLYLFENLESLIFIWKQSIVWHDFSWVKLPHVVHELRLNFIQTTQTFPNNGPVKLKSSQNTVAMSYTNTK